MPSNLRLAGEEGRSSAWISYATETQADNDYIPKYLLGSFRRA